MSIMIGIPTVSPDRFDLLREELESIKASTYKDINIIIVVDGDAKLYEKIKRNLTSFNISVIRNRKRRGWVASTNRVFKQFLAPYYIYASDDLVFPPDLIKNAMKLMREKFPDGDGVVTLGRRHKAIFGLIGNKWVERFPSRQVFCPFYTHYGSDPEHTELAHKLERFAFHPNRDLQVKHYRRNDETRRFSRSSRDHDLALYRDRQERGRLWGVDFER